MSTIITRNSATSGSVPSSLVQGELAINITNNRLFFGSGSGNAVKEFGVSASYAQTASYLNTLNQDLTFNGNLTLNGTASIAFLNVTYESASVIYSSGSNQFGDASNDVQTLWGTVDIKTGPVLVTGSQYMSGSIYLQNNPNSIYFSGSGAASRLVWNNTDGTLDLGLKGGNVTLQIGQETVARVVNKSGGNLLESNFQAVRVRSVAEGGAQGQRLAVVLAQADSDADSATTLGIVTETIPVNQEGFITLFGQVREIDTTGAKSYGGLETWVDGDMLYLSPFYPGYLTNVKPIAPQHLVIIGYVEYAHQNNGKIFVKIDNGWELGELHNVLDNSTTSSYGDLLVRSGSVWTNSKQLTGSYGLTGSLTATSFTGSLQGTATSASHALTASYVNPLNQTVEITGSLQVQNSIDSSFRFLIDSLGTSSLNWEDGYLYNGGGSISVDWKDRKLYDSNVDNSVNWNSRQLFKSDGTTVTLDWETGAFTGSMLGTASYALQALSSSFATTASYVQTAQTASYVLNAVSASFARTASYVQNAQTSSYVLNAISASYATQAVSASYATQAGNASTIDINVFGSDVESYLLMSNVAGTTGVAIGGDGDLRYNSSTNKLSVGSVSATSLTGSLLGTASYATQALSSSYSVTASYYGGSVTSASYAQTASYALNAGDSIWTASGADIYYNGGDVGIGTSTPAQKLEVAGNIYINGGNGEGFLLNGGLAIYRQNGADLAFNTNGSEKVRILSDGNVGIGTTTPAYKLSVVGKMALNDGGDSVFIGTNAGLSDDATANLNVAIGTSALQNNLTGASNVAVGYLALNTNLGSTNTALGTYALQLNTTGTSNTAVGAASQLNSGIGTFNTSVGTNTLFLLATGSSNVALGSSALRNAVSSSFNTAVGVSALINQTSGSGNTAIGIASLTNNITGSNNTALGRNSGRYFGTGTSNNNTDASASIFIGFNSRANASGETNQIVIGSEALGLGSNTIVLGNDNVTTTALKGNVGIGTTTPQGKLAVDGGNIYHNYGNAASPYYLYLNHNGSQDGGMLWTRDNSTFDWQINNLGANGNLSFYSYGLGSTAVTFQRSNGYVGIGATSPTSKLEVAGALGGTVGVGGSTLKLTNTDTGNYSSITAGVTGVTNNGMQFSTDGTARMIIASSGNISIGTTSSPGNRLITSQDATYNNENTYGIAAAASTNNDCKTLIGYDYSNDIGVLSAVRAGVGWKNLSINPNGGNVGIGTITPSYLLDVNGTARVTTLIETSAAKYKTNIQPLEPQLSKVTQLEPVTFDWLDKPQTKTNIGLIADEVEKIYPEFVSKTDDGEIEGIEYSKLTTVLIQSIKELKAIVDQQQDQINELLNK